MPEKTRDHKYWFPRFKSNWLGTYRSKQMFPCCECANVSKRYKPVEGTHCCCGADQWKNAKAVEEDEYSMRSALSKSYGGIRYEEALSKKRSYCSEPEDTFKRIKYSVSSTSLSSPTASFTSPGPLVRSPSSIAMLPPVADVLYQELLEPEPLLPVLEQDLLRLEPQMCDMLDVLTDKDELDSKAFCNSFFDLESPDPSTASAELLLAADVFGPSSGSSTVAFDDMVFSLLAKESDSSIGLLNVGF